MLLFAISSERSAFAQGDWAPLQPGQKGPHGSGGAEQALRGDPLPLAFGATNVLNSQVKAWIEIWSSLFQSNRAQWTLRGTCISN